MQKIFHGKMAQINQISKKQTKSTIFDDKFYRFSQEYRRKFFLNCTFICKMLPNLAKLFSG
jgi:mannose/fructose/N-acetylgalactosamine-specific phosphotransferase system component IID